MNNDLYLGLDFGTSGARTQVIDANGSLIAQAHCSYDINQWQSWLHALTWLFATLPAPVRHRIKAIAIDGTSSTVLLCDETNTPLHPPQLYNDDHARVEAERIAACAPRGHIAAAPSASLAKLLYALKQPHAKAPAYFTDQASWLAAMLTGQPGYADYHNALKLGYDAAARAWPDWMRALKVSAYLPRVLTPGALLGAVTREVASKLDIPPTCRVRAGTTDSIAAFIASGACTPGDAVTSLGSTLVLKLLSTQRVEDVRYGIYSHRLGSRWLAGGASNSGGAVLRQFFDDAALDKLSQQIDPARPSGLDYYPLPAIGERFPINDPQLAPRLTPRPANDVQFLHGLLEGIASIETLGYALLAKCGATPVKRVLSAGGGAKNMAWHAIRELHLGVPVSPALHAEAAYGAARLAQFGDKLLS
ncbi:MAG: FGGY-family carbohydrate kinase [Hydrogenophilales bacterium]|nr:FGGY-family carbohydrate kinase [Hydrogenophilales bacterium]